MRSYPTDKWDQEELTGLNAEPWMVAQLKLNPEYPHWGPYEDYMWNDGDGWNGRIVHDTWSSFGPWNLDDLNEIVNFYFTVDRASEKCSACDGSGYGPDAKRISDDWYDFSDSGRRWCDKITQDEAQALYEHDRLNVWNNETRKWERPAVCPSAEEVNRTKGAGRGFEMHDAINRSICIEQRCKRLGFALHCSMCEGHGDVFTESVARLGLVLWVIHPRKGASRGVHVKRIERDELRAVFSYLRQAADRNAARFAKIPEAL